MPRVPIYEPQAQERPLGAPQVHVDTSGAFGEAVGQGLQQLGQGLQSATQQLQSVATQHFQEEKKKQDSARAMDAYSKLGAWKNGALYDPQNGALAKKGENALGLTDPYIADFDKTAQKIRGSLANDEQRAAFEHIFQQERESAYRELARHEGQQADVLAAHSFDAAVDTAVSNGVNAKDEQSILNAKTMGENAILARAKTLGWKQEESEAALRNFRTKLHLGVLDHLTDEASGDPSQAKAYLDKYGGEIDGVARGKSNVDKVVAAAGLRDRSRAESMRIQTENPDDYGKQLEAAKAIKDTNLYDHTVQRLNADFASGEKARKDAEVERLGRLGQAIDRNPYIARSEVETSKDFQQLSDEGKAKALDKWRATQRQNRASGNEDHRLAAEARREQKAANDLAATTLRNAVKDDAEHATTLDLKKEFPGVDDQGLASLQLIQTGAKNIVKKGHQENLADLGAKVKAAAAAQWPLVVGDPEAEGAVKQHHEAFSSHMVQWFTQQSEKNSTPPTQAEAAKEMASYMLSGQVERRFLPNTKRVQGEVKPGETFIIDKAEDQKYGPSGALLRQPAQPAPKAAAAAPDNPAPPPAGKVRIVGPGGKAGLADEAGLDAWLKAHPTWRRM